jgi:uncharacterized protein YcfJ
MHTHTERTVYVTNAAPMKTHKHETAKGAIGGAVVASVVPGIGTVVGAVVGGVVGHHYKKKHIREGTHRM